MLFSGSEKTAPEEHSAPARKSRPVAAHCFRAAAWALFLLCLAGVFCYLLGAVRSWDEARQLFILEALALCALALALASFLGAAVNAAEFFLSRRVPWEMGMYGFLGIIGAVTAALAVFVIVAARGNWG